MKEYIEEVVVSGLLARHGDEEARERYEIGVQVIGFEIADGYVTQEEVDQIFNELEARLFATTQEESA